MSIQIEMMRVMMICSLYDVHYFGRLLLLMWRLCYFLMFHFLSLLRTFLSLHV